MTKKVLAGVLALLLPIFALMIFSRMNTSVNPLRVWIPFQALSAQEKFIDPNNTATVYEYYLLENLASSLVQDSTEHPSGFEGIFVSSWTQASENEVILSFKENLKWSDGSSMTTSDWDFLFSRLANSQARHHVYVKRIKSWSWISSQTVKLEFSMQIHLDSLLNELSLADSALLTSANLSGDWSITSGPYYVDRFEYAEKVGTLVRSSYHPLFHLRPLAPSVVEIVDDWKSSEVLMLNSPATSTKLATFEELFPQKTDSAFSSILFLSWNPEHPFSRNEEIRRQWRQWILNIQKRWTLPFGFRSESQMIPLGYSGRLESVVESQDADVSSLQGKEFAIGVWTSMVPLKEIWGKLIEEADKSGFKIKIQKQEYWETSQETALMFSSFRGNQKSAVGSWAFLMSEKSSALVRGDSKIQDAWKELIVSESSSRDSSLLRFHAVALETGYWIPLASSFSRLYFSNRISAKRVNPFDLRLRFLDFE